MKINQIVHLSESVSESTGDKPFDQMMTTIKRGTNKQKTADRKEQQKQTQQQARNAFGNMFGGGNPADKLKIKEQGVAEAEKKGLYYYVNKRKKAGTSRDADSPKAPTAQAWKDAAKTAKTEAVAEGSLNEFAQGNGGDDGEAFNPGLAKMAQEHGFTKGFELADGASLATAFKITEWDQQFGGLYKQHFVQGFKKGRIDKINHNNKQHNLNLKLMKDGSIIRGEQGVAEGWDKLTPQQKAHEYNLDAAQKEMDRRHAQGEDMTGAKIDKKTYKIVKPKKKDVSENKLPKPYKKWAS